MSESSERARSQPPVFAVARRVVIGILAILFGMFLFVGFVFDGHYYLIGFFTVLTGWLSFMSSVFPNISWNSSAILTATVSGVLFLGGTHMTARWLWSARPHSHSWRWGWTFSIGGTLLLVFTAGIAVIGTVHQVTWLARSDEPFLHKDRYRGSHHTLLMTIRNGLDARSENDPTLSQEAALSIVREAIGQTGATNQRVAVLAGPDGQVRCIAVEMKKGFVGFVEWRQPGSDKQADEHIFYKFTWDEFVSDVEAGKPLTQYYYRTE